MPNDEDETDLEKTPQQMSPQPKHKIVKKKHKVMIEKFEASGVLKTESQQNSNAVQNSVIQETLNLPELNIYIIYI